MKKLKFSYRLWEGFLLSVLFMLSANCFGQLTEFNLDINDPELAISSFDAGGSSSTVQLKLSKFPAGNPDIIALSAMILLPNGNDPDIRVTYSDSVFYGEGYIKPVAPAVYETNNDSLPDEHTYRNEEVYGSTALFPTVFHRIKRIGKIRGREVAMLFIYPFKYNPVKKETFLYRDLKIEVKYVGVADGFPGNLAAEYDPTESEPETYDPIRNRAINYDQVIKLKLSESKKQLKSAPVYSEGFEYLIITKDSLKLEADRLSAHKNSKGISTKIISFPNAKAVSPNDIEACIDSCYNNCEPPPNYVLLLGDVDILPVSNKLRNKVSDLPYFDIEDVVPRMADFSSGRVPVSTINDASVWVNKVIAYEGIPITDEFFKKTAIVSFFKPQSKGNGREQRRYIRTSEELVSFFQKEAMAVDRLYFSKEEQILKYTNLDAFMMGHDSKHGPIGSDIQLPNEKGFTWNKGNTDVVNSFNSNRFLIIHRGHGGNSEWGAENHTQFHSQDVQNLTNKKYPSIVWSINCNTGNFDLPGQDCISERLLKHDSGGAVGVIAATCETETLTNDYLLHGLTSAVWTEFKKMIRGQDFIEEYGYLRLGDVLRNGLLDIVNTMTDGDDEIPNKIMNHIYSYHLLGDPTLKVLPVTGCSAKINVENTIIQSGEVAVTNKANLIEIQNGYQVNPGGKASFAAGERIVFSKGFKVVKGGNLYATLEPCPELEPRERAFKNSTNEVPKIAKSKGKETIFADNPQQLKLFPNPSEGIIHIEIAALPANAKIKVYNQLGELVKDVSSNNYNGQIDLRDYPKGAYFIRILTDKEVLKGRFMLY